MSLITVLTTRKQEIGGQKWRKIWTPADVARWKKNKNKKKRYVRAINDIIGSIAGQLWPRRNFRLEYYILKPFGQDF